MNSRLNLGDFFRKEREAKGINLEQVSTATKISVRMLQHLEGNQYDSLPALPFVRGFILSYARFLNLNEESALKMFDQISNDLKFHEQSEQTKKYDGALFEKNEIAKSRTILWVILSSIFLLSLVSYFVIQPALKRRNVENVNKLNELNEAKKAEIKKDDSIASVQVSQVSVETKKNELEIEKPQATSNPVVKQPSKSQEELKDFSKKDDQAKQQLLLVTPETEPVEATAASDPEVDEKDPLNKGDDYPYGDVRYRFVLKALENFWVRYQVDDKPINSFILLKEKFLVLKAKKNIWLQVSDHKNIEYRYRSNTFEPLENFKKGLAQVDGNYIWVIPSELESSKKASPFSGLPPLSKL